MSKSTTNRVHTNVNEKRSTYLYQRCGRIRSMGHIDYSTIFGFKIEDIFEG